MHCVILGGGVFGVTGAIALRERGHRVSLVDAGPVPHPDASSTDISKVVRMDYGADEFYCALMERAMDGWRAYNDAWSEPLYHEHGFCILSSTPLQPGTFEGDSYALLTQRGHTLQRLDRRAIASRYPLWTPGRFVDGYYNPRAGWAESARVIEALARRARELGVRIREHARAVAIVETDARVTGIRLHDGDTIQADIIIVAMGAWTTTLVPEFDRLLTTIGQPVFHFRPERPERFAPPALVPWAADIQNTGFYGFPVNRDGVVKVANHGAGIPIDDRTLPDERILTDGYETRFREFLRASLPELADAPIAHRRLCRYCDSKDGDFVIARSPDRDGLVVATGGSGHGFKFAPILGDVIADAALGIDNPAHHRFAWRTSAEQTYEHARCPE